MIPLQHLRSLYDHCARYLAHIQAEACALLGDTADLLETWNAHRAYLEGEPSPKEWFKGNRKHLLKDVPAMVGFLRQNRLSPISEDLVPPALEPLEQNLRIRARPMDEGHPVVFWWLIFLAILALIANIG